MEADCYMPRSRKAAAAVGVALIAIVVLATLNVVDRQDHTAAWALATALLTSGVLLLRRQ